MLDHLTWQKQKTLVGKWGAIFMAVILVFYFTVTNAFPDRLVYLYSVTKDCVNAAKFGGFQNVPK